jgi:hypothetical protein
MNCLLEFFKYIRADAHIIRLNSKATIKFDGKVIMKRRKNLSLSLNPSLS